MASDQVTQLVLGVGVSTALHPITYAKTLIQVKLKKKTSER